jgi:hypothetical protein
VEVPVQVEVQALQVILVLQELLAQVDYQEMTLLTQVDGYMMEQVLHLPQHSLRQIVQQYLL